MSEHRPELPLTLRRWTLLFVMLVVPLSIGAVVAQVARPHFEFEAEAGTLTSAQTINDSGAGRGQAIHFSVSSGPSGKRCTVNLHGKGGNGGPPWVDGAITHTFPTGNGDGGGWGPHHWEYPAESNYQVALNIINNEISASNCGQVVLIGFSNGAAMAAKMYCRGNNLGNKLVGVIIDDPVPDQGVNPCNPPANISMRLIQSDDMNWLQDGMACPGGWTCQGTVYSRGAYQTRIGAANVLIKASHSPSNDIYPIYYSGWWR